MVRIMHGKLLSVKSHPVTVGIDFSIWFGHGEKKSGGHYCKVYMISVSQLLYLSLTTTMSSAAI